MVMTLAAISKWKLYTIDVTQAFIQSDDLQKDDKQYVILPPFIQIKSASLLHKCPCPGIPLSKKRTYMLWNGMNLKAKRKLSSMKGLKWV